MGEHRPDGFGVEADRAPGPDSGDSETSVESLSQGDEVTRNEEDVVAAASLASVAGCRSRLARRRGLRRGRYGSAGLYGERQSLVPPGKWLAQHLVDGGLSAESAARRFLCSRATSSEYSLVTRVIEWGRCKFCMRRAGSQGPWST